MKKTISLTRVIIILFNSLLKDRIASERLIQADEAAAEPKDGDKVIAQAANGMNGKMYRVSLAQQESSIHVYDIIYIISMISSKGGSRRREKNRKVLLMMMRAFAPSAANASDATTTSDLGSGLSSGSQSNKAHKANDASS